VRGVDHGDGWLQHGSRFLPLVVNGIQVLVRQVGVELTSAPSSPAAASARPPPTLAGPAAAAPDEANAGPSPPNAHRPDSPSVMTTLAPVAPPSPPELTSPKAAQNSRTVINQSPSPSAAQSHVLETGPPEKTYLVDNSLMGAKTRGLAYRRSKRLEDRDGTAVAGWGGMVKGIDQGDGWLKLGSRYLPLSVNGTPVLRLQGASPEDEVAAAAASLSTTTPTTQSAAEADAAASIEVATNDSSSPLQAVAGRESSPIQAAASDRMSSKTPSCVPEASDRNPGASVSTSALDDEALRLARAQPKLRPGKLMPLQASPIKK